MNLIGVNILWNTLQEQVKESLSLPTQKRTLHKASSLLNSYELYFPACTSRHNTSKNGHVIIVNATIP